MEHVLLGKNKTKPIAEKFSLKSVGCSITPNARKETITDESDLGMNEDFTLAPTITNYYTCQS